MSVVARIGLGVAFAAISTMAVASDDQPVFSSGRGFDQRSGEAIYRAICQGCHMPDGRGATGAAAYPALAGNPRIASAPYVLITVLNGRRNMPSFARGLDDAQVAAVAGFVRTRLGNAYPEPVTPDQVAALRNLK